MRKVQDLSYPVYSSNWYYKTLIVARAKDLKGLRRAPRRANPSNLYPEFGMTTEMLITQPTLIHDLESLGLQTNRLVAK
jgi:hypothetical protein